MVTLMAILSILDPIVKWWFSKTAKDAEEKVILQEIVNVIN